METTSRHEILWAIQNRIALWQLLQNRKLSHLWRHNLGSRRKLQKTAWENFTRWCGLRFCMSLIVSDLWRHQRHNHVISTFAKVVVQRCRLHPRPWTIVGYPLVFTSLVFWACVTVMARNLIKILDVRNSHGKISHMTFTWVHLNMIWYDGLY